MGLPCGLPMWRTLRSVWSFSSMNRWNNGGHRACESNIKTKENGRKEGRKTLQALYRSPQGDRGRKEIARASPTIFSYHRCLNQPVALEVIISQSVIIKENEKL